MILNLNFIIMSEIMNFEFDRIDLICVGVSTVFGIWYLAKKVCFIHTLFLLK